MATETITTITIIVTVTDIITVMIARGLRRYIDVTKFEGVECWSKICMVSVPPWDCEKADSHNFIAKSLFHEANLIHWKVIRRKPSGVTKQDSLMLSPSPTRKGPSVTVCTYIRPCVTQPYGLPDRAAERPGWWMMANFSFQEPWRLTDVSENK